ncbi:MAG: T9SS type A sorting domain-containing protein [Candidatus Kuenenbacteria bacterium]
MFLVAIPFLLVGSQMAWGQVNPNPVNIDVPVWTSISVEVSDSNKRVGSFYYSKLELWSADGNMETTIAGAGDDTHIVFSPELTPNMEYCWRVSVSVGFPVNPSETWNFRTLPIGPLIEGSDTVTVGVEAHYQVFFPGPDSGQAEIFVEWERDGRANSKYLNTGDNVSFSHIWSKPGVYEMEVSAHMCGSPIFYKAEKTVTVLGAESAVGDLKSGIVVKYDLGQNYPNPFNPTTSISFALTKKDMTKLVVYNTMGQAIRTLVDYEMTAGNHHVIWDGLDDNFNPVSSGVYLYQLISNGQTQSKRMLLMK